MRCPTLRELPPPPPDKTGWPWTEESPQLPDTTPNGRPWPKISIITPNYNYGQFIEETIRSVLLQGYPNLEYIIIDGGSTDNSIEIIKRYEQWIAYWTSEPDDGLYDAINKGIKISTGDIIGIVNSDDYYGINVLPVVAQALHNNPDVEVITGGAIIFEKRRHESPKIIREYLSETETALSLQIIMKTPIINARFIRKNIYNIIGKYNTQYRLTADLDFLIRITLERPKQITIDKQFYYYRQHQRSLTFNPRNLSNEIICLKEHIEIAKKYLRNKNLQDQEKNLFKKWYDLEITRLVIYTLKKGKLLESTKYMLQGYKHNKQWILTFMDYVLNSIVSLIRNMETRRYEPANKRDNTNI